MVMSGRGVLLGEVSLFGGDGPTSLDMEVFFYGLTAIKGDGDEQTHSIPSVDVACSVDCRIIWRRVGCLGLRRFLGREAESSTSV